MAEEEKKEVGYFNNSTRQVIPGFSPLYHSFSKGAKDIDSKGTVKHVEDIAGRGRPIDINLGGQLKLDRDRRGGKRLWERIYDREDMYLKMEEYGVSVLPEAKKETKSKSSKKDDKSE